MAKALRVAKIATAVAIAAVCALLIWQAVDIYITGNAPENFSAPGVRIEPVYSRGDIVGRLGRLAPALWALLAVAAADLIVDAAAGKREKPRALRAPEERVRALRASIPEIPPECKAEEKKRRNVRLIAAFICLVCAIAAGVYLLDPENFSSLELESVMGVLILRVAPWAALALAAVCAASVISGRSAQRELELLRSVAKRPEADAPAAKRFPLAPIRAVLYAAAVALTVLGVLNGGLWDVLVKAINICTECIGLG